MALGHLARDPLRDVVGAEPAALLGELREEEDLEEQVAELVAQRARRALVERRERLVGLFEQVRLEGFEGLFPVPRAFAPQAGDERDEAIERFGHGRMIVQPAKLLQFPPAGREPVKEEEKPIRVVDRRMFTPDGELRPDFETEEAPEPPKAPPAPAPPPPRPAAAAEAPAEPGAAGERATSQAFLTLVSFLATNVYAALGIDAMTGKTLPRRDPAAAQQMIEWLVVLEQKSRGNLNFEETDLLSRALYELRMAYVEAVRPPGREPAPPGG